jgi:hypothetical protein
MRLPILGGPLSPLLHKPLEAGSVLAAKQAVLPCLAAGSNFGHRGKRVCRGKQRVRHPKCVAPLGRINSVAV